MPSGRMIASPADDAWAVIRQRRADHPVAVTQPLLLISQIQRSGGTLLSRLFDGHPACFAHPWELQWNVSHKALWPNLRDTASPRPLFEKLTEKWLPRMISKARLDKTLRNHGGAPFVFDRELQQQIFTTMVRRASPPSRRAILDAYLTSLFNAWLDYAGLDTGPKQYVTAFTPRLIMYPDQVAEMRRDYPDGLLVSIVRDPVSWFASARRHRPNTYGEVEHAIALWTASTRATLTAHEDDPERTIGLMFDDLVGRTDRTMRAICDRTALAFDESLRTPSVNGYRVASNSSFNPAEGIDLSPTDRTADVSPAEADRIRERTAALYEQARARFALAR